jgi:hypothetical protein
MKQKTVLRRPGAMLTIPLLVTAVFSVSTLGFFPAPAQAGPAKEQPRQSAATPRAVAAQAAPAKDQLRPGAATPRPSSSAADLEALSQSAEDVFDLAMAGKMDRMAKKMELLKKSSGSLSYLQDQSNSILLPRLGQTVAELEQAIAAKDRFDTMRFANRITLIAATVAIPLKPTTPTEVSLLAYNGRELAIWAELKKTEKLSSIVMRMHLAWQTLMPKLIERNALKELRRFSEIMGHLETAKTPEEYGRLSRQVASEVDTMKVIFAKSAK